MLLSGHCITGALYISAKSKWKLWENLDKKQRVKQFLNIIFWVDLTEPRINDKTGF